MPQLQPQAQYPPLRRLRAQQVRQHQVQLHQVQLHQVQVQVQVRLVEDIINEQID